MAYQKPGTNIGKTIDLLEFTDVSLVKEDDQMIPAHSIVLALPNSVSEMDPKYHCLGPGEIFSNTQQNQMVYVKTHLKQPHCSMILRDVKT